MHLDNLKHFRTLWQIIKPKPKALYKYHRINRNLIKLLINNSLWAGSASNLNDPYDCDFEIDEKYFKESIIDKLSFKEMGISSISNEDEKGFWDGVVASFTKDQIKTFQHFYIKHIGVCCFNSDAKTELMWSHYADSAKGVCLEFDFSSNNYFKKKLIPIRYSDKAIVAKSKTDLTKALIKKRKAWSYEKEWRVLDNIGLLSFDKKELVRVIFGPRVSKECYTIVVKALAKYGYTPILSRCIYSKNGLEIKDIMDTKKFFKKENSLDDSFTKSIMIDKS